MSCDGQSIDQIKAECEKRISDLKQLIGISRDFNSTLEFPLLVESILFVFMGQLQLLHIGLFIRDQFDQGDLSLYRNYKGFQVDHSFDYTLREKSSLIPLLQKRTSPCTLNELMDLLPPDEPGLTVLRQLMPSIVVPLTAKGTLVGVLALGHDLFPDFSAEIREQIMIIGPFAAMAIYNALLYEMATTDMMTKLRLRHYFLSFLNEAVEDARRKRTSLSILFLDIDNFKAFNDSHGHSCGDFVLIKVADLIRGSIRRVDLAARYGGEEFIVLLPDTDNTLAVHVAERIRSKIEKAVFFYEGEPVKTSISIGVAELQTERDFTCESLIKRADTALYQAKERGRNRVVLAE
jgi:two-component system, cell cycle response regulator